MSECALRLRIPYADHAPNDSYRACVKEKDRLEARSRVWEASCPRRRPYAVLDARGAPPLRRHRAHAGVDVYSISKALGHANIKVTEPYLRGFDTAALDEKMQELFGGVQ